MKHIAKENIPTVAKFTYFAKKAKNYEEFSSCCDEIGNVAPSFYMNAAESCAFEGNDKGVDFFLRYKPIKEVFNAVAKGYARAGQEKYTDKADPRAIAEGFARGAHYSRIDDYIQNNIITIDDAITCYIKAENDEKVEEYYQKYENNINLDQIVYNYATANNDEQVKKWLDRGASLVSAVRGYYVAAKGSAATQIDIHEQAKALKHKYPILLAKIDNYIDNYIKESLLSLDDAVACYIKAQNHEKVEEYYQKYGNRINIDQIVYTYAVEENSQQVNKWLGRGASPAAAVQGYTSVEADILVRILQEKYQNLPKTLASPNQTKENTEELHQKLRQMHIDLMVNYWALGKDRDVRIALTKDTQPQIELLEKLVNIKQLIVSRLDECLLDNKKNPCELGFWGSSHSITYIGKKFSVPEGIAKIYTIVADPYLYNRSNGEWMQMSARILEIASSKIKNDKKSFWSKTLEAIKSLLGMGRTKDTENLYEKITDQSQIRPR